MKKEINGRNVLYGIELRIRPGLAPESRRVLLWRCVWQPGN